jgi:hypothetical protein
VIAWEYPAFFGWAPVSPDDVDFAKVAEETLAAAITEVLGRPAPTPMRLGGPSATAWARTRYWR